MMEGNEKKKCPGSSWRKKVHQRRRKRLFKDIYMGNGRKMNVDNGRNHIVGKLKIDQEETV